MVGCQTYTLKDSVPTKVVLWENERKDLQIPGLRDGVVGMVGVNETDEKNITWEMRLDHDKQKHFHVNLDIHWKGIAKRPKGNTDKYAFGPYVKVGDDLQKEMANVQYEQFRELVRQLTVEIEPSGFIRGMNIVDCAWKVWNFWNRIYPI